LNLVSTFFNLVSTLFQFQVNEPTLVILYTVLAHYCSPISAFFRPTCRSPTSFLSRSEICIDLFSSFLLLRRNCYRKEILLLWRYCFLDQIYRHEICVKVEKILFDSLLSYFLQVKGCYFFSFFVRESICESISLNLAKFPSGLFGVIFSTDWMLRCLGCLKASSRCSIALSTVLF